MKKTMMSQTTNLTTQSQRPRSLLKQKQLVVAYGNARFSHSAKYSVTSPTKYVREKCAQDYETVEVGDEFRTSTMPQL